MRSFACEFFPGTSFSFHLDLAIYEESDRIRQSDYMDYMKLMCQTLGYTPVCSAGKRWGKKRVPLNLVSAHWANLGRYREIGDARAHRDLLDGGARHHRIDHRWRR